MSDGSHHIAQVFLGRRGIVDVVRRDIIQLQRLRQFDQGGGTLIVIRTAVMMQFDKETAFSKERRIRPRDITGGGFALTFECTRDLALAPAGQSDQPIGVALKLFEVEESPRPSALDAAPA